MATRAKAKAKAKPDDDARADPLIPAAAAVLLDERAVRLLLGVGESKLNEMRAVGDYPPPTIRIGRLVKWTTEAHNAAVARLAEREAKANARG